MRPRHMAKMRAEAAAVEHCLRRKLSDFFVPPAVSEHMIRSSCGSDIVFMLAAVSPLPFFCLPPCRRLLIKLTL